MSEALTIALFVALVVVAALVVAVLLRQGSAEASRTESAREAADLRARLDAFAKSAAEHERDMRTDLGTARKEQGEAAAVLRREVGERLAQFQQGTQQQLADANTAQRDQLKQFGDRLGALTESVEQKLETLRADNAQKLDQMRATVDEKLQATLDQRLGASFKQVSDRLEQVHKGLGEMQSLAIGVGDLKRVLTNVKTRGTWGEVQLAALLSEVLTPQQYDTNVETVPGTGKRVEFAIRLPGRGDVDRPCWLPVDAKFPLDDWQRLQDALERADAPAADLSRKSLADFLRLQAKTIHDLYVAAPYTTDFAILFVPTEGLYAEMMSRPGFAEALQRDYRVTLTGPTNFLALLNSLQMGFRTLAIEQRSSEVWKVLGQVKSEFGKFGEILDRTSKKLDDASRTIHEARGKSTTIVRRLRNVEEMPGLEATRLLDTVLPVDAGGDGDADNGDDR